jgi:hypothetical protein
MIETVACAVMKSKMVVEHVSPEHIVKLAEVCAVFTVVALITAVQVQVQISPTSSM